MDQLHNPPPPPQHAIVDSPYEYISSRNVQMVRQQREREKEQEAPPPLAPPPQAEYGHGRAFANSIYMDHREVDRARQQVDPRSGVVERSAGVDMRSGVVEEQDSRVDMSGQYIRPR
jgi:hypothetical protein